MIRKIGLILIFLSSLYLVSIYLNKKSIVKEETVKISNFLNIEKDNINLSKRDKNNYYMILEIPKINLKKGLYSIDSNLNNVDFNLEILSSSSMPDTQNSNLIIAGHSGTSEVSYFKNLYKLTKDDYCYIYYNGSKYIYQITNIYSQPKIGKITIYRDNNLKTLTLITCTLNNNDMQTVYIGNLVNMETY